ncbi:flavin monoamine oxidase family protein [Alteribacter aurantiacus]|uniref:flavin monoamine oxidase family protein n=1 Tax=Alteribacter aurantiacus TaxID=254410 RepID=UPI00040B13A6|nr:flavin monoamine oxidase family protein [Alteribacter aurantiacus]
MKPVRGLSVLTKVHAEPEQEHVEMIKRGLPQPAKKKRIIVLGAGMAGLVSASLLKEAGHSVILLEGNSRVGGRVHTLRKPFRNGDHFEGGAMRIPSHHQLTMTYVQKFHLPVIPFVNATDNDLIYMNGKLVRRFMYEDNPDLLAFPVDEKERGLTAVNLLRQAVAEFAEQYVAGTKNERGRLLARFARFTKDGFLRENPLGESLSDIATYKINTMLGIGGFHHLSFTDILLNITSTIFGDNVDFFQIKGGNDQLPKAFLPYINDHLHVNRTVMRIVQDNTGVQVTAEDERKEQHVYFGDVVVCTLPFSVLRLVDIWPHDSLSFAKQRAIRELVYVQATKVGIEFKRKFWEDDALYGGSLITDLPLQFMYYPSHNINVPGPGILKACYAWGENANLWDAMEEEERVDRALSYVAHIHGEKVKKLATGGVSVSWGSNPFSAGCFSMFKPYQHGELPSVIRQPEGRIHFAGEHTSRLHAWIEGAIESGVRVAEEVNKRII